MIDQRYGHLARDSEESIRTRLEARKNRLGVEWASTASRAMRREAANPHEYMVCGRWSVPGSNR
jgi:hypothetical protein